MTHRVTSPRPLAAALACSLACSLAACGDVPAPAAPTVSRPVFERGGGLGSADLPLHLNTDATAICGFPVYDAYVGRTKTIALPGDRSILIFPQGRQTYVNGLTGKSITFSAAGTGHLNPLPGGGLEFVIAGRNGLGLVLDGKPSFVIASGHFSIVFGPDGSVVQPLGGVGEIVDGCELLR